MAITTSGTTLTFNDSTTQTTAPVNTNANVNSVSAGTGISVNSTTGAVTVTNSGVTSVAAGTGISVSASTGGVTITNSAPAVTAGEAKAWAKWNGNGSISGVTSYNVSSVVRNSTGNYTVNFTNAFVDGNYSSQIQASYDLSTGTGEVLTKIVSQSTSALNFFTGSYLGAPADSQYLAIACFR